MKKLLLMALVLLLPLAAHARLPAPTDEEAAKAKAAAEKKSANEAAAKQALSHAQNRVVQRYRAAHNQPDKPHTSATDPAEPPIGESAPGIEE